MKFNILAAVTAALLGTLMVAQKNMAAEFPNPKVEFSADMTMTIEADGGGQPYHLKGKIFSAKDKERREVSSFGRKTIVIKSDNETLTLMPEQKIYMKSHDPKSRKDPETMIRDGELKMTKDGTEKINGQVTTRYKIESVQEGKESFNGHAWFTKQNIPVRFKGTARDRTMRQNVEINYFNIAVAKQDPYLFAAPKDYRLLPTGLGGVGGGPAQKTPEQIKRMKEMMKQRRRQ